MKLNTCFILGVVLNFPALLTFAFEQDIHTYIYIYIYIYIYMYVYIYIYIYFFFLLETTTKQKIVFEQDFYFGVVM